MTDYIKKEELLEKLNKKNDVKEKNYLNNKEFQIDDIILNSNIRTIKRVNNTPRIVAIIIVAIIIIGLCFTVAFMSSNVKSNSLYGSWKSSNGIIMKIEEDLITIGDQTRKYIISDSENNVIALNVNNEYFKIMYRIENDKLFFIIPLSEEKSSVIEYKRIEE